MFLGTNFEPPPVHTRTALLAIDFQRDFTSKDGNLPVADAENIVRRVAALANEFRENGDIVWATTEFQGPRETVSKDTGAYSVILPRFLPSVEDTADNGNGQVSSPASPASSSKDRGKLSKTDREAFLADLPDDGGLRCCLPGSQGSEMDEQLASVMDTSRDICVTKSNYSAFADESLLLTLRTKLVTELYLCGSLSHISVYATAIDAIRYGFTINILEDCVGHGNAECHAEALRQMRDILGAEFVTSFELLEDLRAAPTSSSQTVVDDGPSFVGIPAATGSSDSLTLRPKVERWISGLSDDEPNDASALEEIMRESKARRDAATPLRRRSTKPRSAKAKHVTTSVPSTSPPRKRSTEDIDPKDTLTIEGISGRRQSPQVSQNPNLSQIDARPPRRRRTDEKSISSNDSLNGTGRRSPPTRQISTPATETRKRLEPKALPAASADPGVEHTGLGEDPIDSDPERYLGEGDAYLVTNFLSTSEIEDMFERVKAEVQWQKMFHRSGEVPRMVSVQGTISEDDSVPIYRHPVDQSLDLLPWSPTVDLIRSRLEKELGQPFNHALIQLYRSGEDNISEHSDKTLDINHGTNIVNFSIGAQRTMVLRTKKGYTEGNISSPVWRTNGSLGIRAGESSNTSAIRQVQRVPLPHNSLFVLGPVTNNCWLHAIRADKRRSAEKAENELAFGNQRISMTFRSVGTYINPRAGLIWGQGAKSKLVDAPNKITDDAGEVERLIKAFGEENHQASDFDWKKTYGGGFDIVNFVPTESTPKASVEPPPAGSSPLQFLGSSESYAESVSILSSSTDPIANLRVKVFLAEMDIPYITQPARPGCAAPLLFVASRRTDVAIEKLQGYEKIAAHFSPMKSTRMDDEAGVLLASWRKSKADPRFGGEVSAVLVRVRQYLWDIRTTCPKYDERVSARDRDLWFVLHEIALSQGGIEGLSDDVVKDFYQSIARTRIFSEALGNDLHRITRERYYGTS